MKEQRTKNNTQKKKMCPTHVKKAIYQHKERKTDQWKRARPRNKLIPYMEF